MKNKPKHCGICNDKGYRWGDKTKVCVCQTPPQSKWKLRMSKGEPIKPKTSECGGGMSRESYFEPTEQTLGVILETLFLRGYNHGLTRGCGQDGETYAVTDTDKAIREWMRAKIDSVIDDRISLWRSHGTEAPLAGIYGHLTLTGELEVLKAGVTRALGLEGEC